MLTWIGLARLASLTALPLLIVPQLPSRTFIVVMLLCGTCLVGMSVRYVRIAGCALLLAAWGLVNAQSLVNDTEWMSTRPAWFVVQIEEVKQDASRIRVRMLKAGNRIFFPPRFAWLSLQDNATAYCPGQRWQMRLRLRAVHARLNEGEFDAQRFAMANHTPVQGRIIKQHPVQSECSWRWQHIRGHRQHYEHLPASATLEALAFGIRDNLSEATRQLLRDTGTAHLMAISGMHIGLAAGTGWLLARGSQFLLPARCISYLYPLIVSWLCAALYTWLSGAQAPAQRALLALTLWAITRIAGVQLSPWQIWTLCVGLLLALDPLTVLSDSFWLSVLAVGMLLTWYRWFPLAERFRDRRRWFLLQLLHLQLGMMILMVPLQAALFNGISLTALLANLFAIPVVSFITVPLIFITLLLPFPALSVWGWQAADLSLRFLFSGLALLPAGWWPLQGAPFLIIAIWGGLLLWRSGVLFSMPFSCSAVALAILFSRHAKPEALWRIDMLDVGHGLSVVISQGGEAVLYDTGPRWKYSDAGSRVILPWLERKGLRLREVILSHRHLDHTGGLSAILQHVPTVWVRSGLTESGHLPCVRGTTWRWKRLHFRVLWPATSPNQGENNDSCVVSVDDGSVRLLLTGDLETEAERQLVRLEKQQLKADILQVPHHGSRTSSSRLLLRSIAGHTAIASVARYNAWRMPAKSVLRNYREHAYDWRDTGQSGQISIKIEANTVQVFSFREQLVPRWYHQWFGVKRESR
ncbi:competence protein ComEC [Pantoea stewartii]|uniref:DNA internalization-related competence protein ComEC/Rec2 n=1 Tax=Pantoea stewartii TaxID=66269 RepID=UPI000543C2CF|nr:DNA internalization-related competence protein ComEC/Rec2 [Pantoea stewartii]KHE03073.1 competence protein ComEC [Pantoea stewartii]KHN62226.1 competence protein ComEC [Pantoea stewartii]